MIGLIRPAEGRILFNGEDLWRGSDEDRQRLARRFGVSYQGGALWSSLTLAENVGLPLAEYTGLSAAELDTAKRGRMLAGTGLFVLGFSAVFILTGVLFGAVGIVWAVVWFWYYRDVPAEHASVNAGERDSRATFDGGKRRLPAT